MVASRFHTKDLLVDSVEEDSVLLHKLLGEQQFLLRKYVVPAAKRVGAILMKFSAPEVAEVVSG